MNTKGSFLFGWIAYTAAFAIGGGIGVYKFVYAPGGRRDRQKQADRQREMEAAREAEEEARIREERRLRQLEESSSGPSASGSSPDIST